MALRVGDMGSFSARFENAKLVEGAGKSLRLKWLAHDGFKCFSDRTDGELLRQKREDERVTFDAVAKIREGTFENHAMVERQWWKIKKGKPANALCVVPSMGTNLVRLNNA